MAVLHRQLRHGSQPGTLGLREVRGPNMQGRSAVSEDPVSIVYTLKNRMGVEARWSSPPPFDAFGGQRRVGE